MADSDTSSRQTRSKMDGDTWLRWNSEFDLARKVKGYTVWQTRGDRIERRYRDDRGDRPADYQDSEPTEAKFNILWSNIQTLKPALLARAPKPVVERRYLDRDEVGRTASVLLERCLAYEIDAGTFYDALEQSVMDRLLPGRGVTWVRYDPVIRKVPRKVAKEEKAATSATSEPNDLADDQAMEKIAESTPVDHINWKDFLHSPARTWREVRWIAKRVFLTRADMRRRGWAKASEIPLTWSPEERSREGGTGEISESVQGSDEWRKAEIWEIWDKPSREVIWWCKSWTSEPCDVKPDFLHLEDFFPIPRPLYATLTNNSLVPVPDYYEYQDQAVELDDLTGRIQALTKAIKVAGVADGRYPELQRLLEEGFENRLILTEQWAEFAQANGLEGSISILPVKDWMSVLNELIMARETVKQVLYEVTGLSDIVRGQGAAQAKTATEQRIKGQFASLRLNDMQKQVGEHARGILRIMGEVIAEHYDPETIFQISGYEQYAKEQWIDPKPGMPGPQGPQPPMMGHNGGPPLDNVVPFRPPPQMPGPTPMQGIPPAAAMGAPGPMAAPAGPAPSMTPGPMQGAGAMGGGPVPSSAAPLPVPPMGMPAQVEETPKQKAARIFKEAIALLRNDKLRGFRIDIEVDSLIEPDQAETQRARTELLGAIAQFLPQAVQAGAAMPEMQPLMAQLLLFFLRAFKAGRSLEGPFEQFIDDLQKKAKNPPPAPPSPEEVKMQGEVAKQKMEGERAQAQFGMDQQKSAMEMDMLRQKNEMELERMRAELEIERERLQIEREKMQMKAQADQQSVALKAEAAERDAAISEQSAVREAVIDEHRVEREMAMSEREHERAEEAGEAEHERRMKEAKDDE